MGYRLTWTAQAANDLQAIAEFIKRDAPHYVASVVDRILATTRSLPEYPLVGRIVPEFDKPEIRELFVFNYRIMYEIKDEQIRVLNIVHGGRLYPHGESAREPEAIYGFRPLPKRGGLVTNELIDRLRDEVAA